MKSLLSLSQYNVEGPQLGMKMSVLLCPLLWSVVEVHSQTEFPYVSFMGETLPNHSYVNLTLVGYDRGNPVRCITDLSTCCI